MQRADDKRYIKSIDELIELLTGLNAEIKRLQDAPASQETELVAPAKEIDKYLAPKLSVKDFENPNHESMKSLKIYLLSELHNRLHSALSDKGANNLVTINLTQIFTDFKKEQNDYLHEKGLPANQNVDTIIKAHRNPFLTFFPIAETSTSIFLKQYGFFEANTLQAKITPSSKKP